MLSTSRAANSDFGLRASDCGFEQVLVADFGLMDFNGGRCFQHPMEIGVEVVKRTSNSQSAIG